MLELCCAACGRANAVRDAAVLDRTRCAECEGVLDEDRPVRYLVAEGGLAHGPLVYRDLVNRVAAGTLTPDMRLSEQDGPWLRAGERADLFPGTRGMRSRAPPRTPTRLRPVRGPPGPVRTLAALDFFVGILLLVITGGAFLLLSTMDALGEGSPALLVLLFLGLGHLALARGLRAGSAGARTIQLALAVLGGIGVLLLTTEGGGAGVLLVGGVVVALPFMLLLDEESRAWFRESSDGT